MVVHHAPEKIIIVTLTNCKSELIFVENNIFHKKIDHPYF